MSRRVPVDLRKRLARVLKRLRAARGLTQEQLAEKAGLNPRHVQKIEVATENVTLSTLDHLGRALGVDPGELLAPGE